MNRLSGFSIRYFLKDQAYIIKGCFTVVGDKAIDDVL